jgi:hypothetical protein
MAILITCKYTLLINKDLKKNITKHNSKQKSISFHLIVRLISLSAKLTSLIAQSFPPFFFIFDIIFGVV